MYDKFMKKKHWKKTFLVMRLSCFLACWLTLSAFGTVFSQQKLVNLKVVAESLSNVLMQIKDQTGVKILYNENLLKNYENINLDLNNVEVEEALRQVLANTRFEYEVTDGVIVVKEKKNSFPQQKTVRIQGKVSDEDGAPLPGVTVLIKGTTLGTATDMDGKYSLSVPEGNYILLFTMVGMKTQEVTLKNQTELNIIMQHETSEMDEVVITGYFNQAKNSFTGAARTITAEELQAGGNQNILSALQNIDPSFVKLENNQLGSNPNAIPDFQIRGAGSISGMRDEYSGNPNMPVFIVDGFETTAEKVFDMDPYRVATITLLKDAAATAIYGSRASNGVVVITTTAPASGKMAVSYNGDATFYMADLSAYNLCNPEEKLELEVLAGLYDVEKKQYFNYGSKFADQAVMQRAYNWRLANIREGVNTYWLDKPLNSLTVAHKHSLRLDGGNDYIRYAMEVNYNNTPGVMKESGRERLGLGLELQYIYKNLTFRNQLNYSRVKATNSPYGSFSEYTRLNPYVKYKDEDGNYIYELEAEDRRSNTGSYKFFIYNPLYNTTLDVRDESRYNDLTNLFGIDWQIIEGLRLKGSFSFTLQNTSADVFKPAKHTDFATYTGDDFDRRGSYSASRGDVFDYDASLVLSYFWQANKHVINANLGWNAKQSRTKEFSVMAEGFPNERLDYISFATQYQKNGSPSGNEYTSRLVGFLGNLNYSWDERYLFDLSFREDASSQFGADKRWAPFWSIGGGWNIHKEHFWSSDNILDLLKIRMSYGITGNQEFQAYQAQTMYQYQTGRLYNTLVPATLMGYGNENLKWQNQYTTNVGVDLGMWKNRLSFMFNYYYKKTDGMLAKITVAPSLGIPSNNFTSNLGEIENKGWEITLSGSPLRMPEADLEWRLSFQISQNRNKLNEISNELKNLNARNNMEMEIPGNVYEEGESMTAIKAVPSLGIDPGTGQEIYVKKDGSLTMEWDAADKILCGDTEPDVFGNISTNLYWKGFNLNAVFQYSIGGDVYNQTLASRVEGVNPSGNADRRVLNDRWTTPGQSALYRNIRDYGQTYVSTRFVQCDNYLDLTSLSLSYDLKKEWIQRFGLESVRVSFYMNDLFRASTVKQERGTSYPFARSFSFGLNIGI